MSDVSVSTALAPVEVLGGGSTVEVDSSLAVSVETSVSSITAGPDPTPVELTPSPVSVEANTSLSVINVDQSPAAVVTTDPSAELVEVCQGPPGPPGPAGPAGGEYPSAAIVPAGATVTIDQAMVGEVYVEWMLWVEMGGVKHTKNVASTGADYMSWGEPGRPLDYTIDGSNLQLQVTNNEASDLLVRAARRFVRY